MLKIKNIGKNNIHLKRLRVWLLGTLFSRYTTDKHGGVSAPIEPLLLLALWSSCTTAATEGQSIELVLSEGSKAEKALWLTKVSFSSLPSIFFHKHTPPPARLF